jgi:hypothetical protein
MMKVYLVQREETEPYEDDIITMVGVYSTRALAEEAGAEHRTTDPTTYRKYLEYEIYEFEVDNK